MSTENMWDAARVAELITILKETEAQKIDDSVVDESVYTKVFLQRWYKILPTLWRNFANARHC